MTMYYSDFEAKLQPCKGKNILLGFSGGADSCALFLILEHWSKIIPFKLTAVHFEHGLRGNDSLHDAEFCRHTAKKYGVEFLQFTLNVPQNMQKNETIEAAARRLRIAKWREITAEMDNFELHLAHHSDDLAENVMLRLFRGANVSGLCGLRELSELDGMTIRRILLQNSRRDIEDFLTAQNFKTYCTDKTNNDCSIGRNFLRNKILRDIEKVFPYAVKGIVQSAAVCELDADFIESAAGDKFNEIKNSAEINNTFWRSLHPALRARVLRSYLSEKLKYDFVPSKNLLNSFNDILNSTNEKFELKIELDADNFYTRRNDLWQIEPVTQIIPADLLWDVQMQPEIIFGDYIYRAGFTNEFSNSQNKFYFDAATVEFPLQITTRREGETFEKFGGTHSSVKEELTNRKIHGSERDKIGILRDKNAKIMLIGNFRRSSFAPICGKNAKILEIAVEKLKK